jgi:hypothetical protein
MARWLEGNYLTFLPPCPLAFLPICQFVDNPPAPIPLPLIQPPLSPFIKGEGGQGVVPKGGRGVVGKGD